MTDLVVHIRQFRAGPLYVLPDDVVYIGRPARGLPGSPFANPFRIGQPYYGPYGMRAEPQPMRRFEALDSYRGWLEQEVAEGHIDPNVLRGKRLACWCRPDRCHGDVLVEWLVQHPPLAVAGLAIVFGHHVMPVDEATTAPAWPPASVVHQRARRRTTDRLRRAL